MTQPLIESDGMTVFDGDSALVVERFEDGRVAAWIGPPGESDGPSVGLSEADRRRVAGFLLDGLQ